MRTSALTQIGFKEAATLWLDSRKPYIHPRTFHDYTGYVRTLSTFFGEVRLPEIDDDLIRGYQKMRMARAGASVINHECSLIQQMLRQLGRWGVEVGLTYQPLPLPRESIGRCLSDAEESRFFKFGLAQPTLCVAAWASLISVNTTAGPGEILHLRRKDVDVCDKLTLSVNAEGAKISSRARHLDRMRVLPLNEAALWAVKLFLERGKSLGAAAPDDYLIPFYIARNHYDPTRPQTHYYKSFNEILADADLDFRPYDFRHTAITRMLEAGVPEETVIAMAGHVSRKMLKRYSHIRLEAKRAAVVALMRKPPEAVRNLLQEQAHQGNQKYS